MQSQLFFTESHELHFIQFSLKILQGVLLKEELSQMPALKFLLHVLSAVKVF